MWAETRFDLHSDLHKFISIHSARVGGDKIEAVKRDKGRWISIHSARVGGDFGGCLDVRNTIIFQSTPPVWAETQAVVLPFGN